MQLSLIFVVLASVYYASALECYKGNGVDVKLVTCAEIKDACSTTVFPNAKDRNMNSRTCASKAQCNEWKTVAIEKKYPYRNYCCYTSKCNDKEIPSDHD